MVKVICFSGLKRSGKDTSADFLINDLENRGVNVKRFMLANLLKKWASNACPKKYISFEDFNGDTAFDREVRCLDYGWDQYIQYVSNFLELIEKYLNDNGIESTFDYGKSMESGRKFITKHFKDGQIDPMGNDIVGISAREILQYFGTDIARCNDDELWTKILIHEIQNSNCEVAVVTDVRMDVEVHLLKRVFDVFIIDVKRANNDAVPTHITDNGISDNLKDITINNDGTLQDLNKTIKMIINENYIIEE